MSAIGYRLLAPAPSPGVRSEIDTSCTESIAAAASFRSSEGGETTLSWTGAVGVTVGVAVGGRLGSSVGKMVGARLGTRVGTTVPAEAGLDGARLGARLGRSDGVALGDPDGRRVGESVGTTDGVAVGLAPGLILGISVGACDTPATVGDAVGIDVATGAGLWGLATMPAHSARLVAMGAVGSIKCPPFTQFFAASYSKRGRSILVNPLLAPNSLVPRLRSTAYANWSAG